MKELYDKAHPHRDIDTREEDLLRRFLDGLYDEKAKEQVEFVKSPQSIDAAVNEVVNYMGTKSRIYVEKKQSTRMVRPSESETDDSDSEVAPVNRIQTRPIKENKGEPLGDVSVKLDSLAKQVQELSEKVNSRPRFKGRRRFMGKCHNCGIEGHKRIHCRLPLQTPTSDQGQSRYNVQGDSLPMNIDSVPFVPQTQDGATHQTHLPNLN